MNLKELYSKIAVAKHSDISISGSAVVYDDGTKIYQMIIIGDQLVPLNTETRDWLNNL